MLSKIVIALISPLGTALLAGFISIILAWFGRKRLSLFCAFFALAWLFLWSLPVVSMVAVRYVEGRFPPVSVQQVPKAAAIVVLGGGIEGTHWPESIGQAADLGQAADRVWHGARLFHAGKAPLVILTGAQYFGQGISEAQAMELFILDLGVPPSAVVLEQRSRTTRENAAYTAQLLQDTGHNDILLVTSALHMERARRHFEARGLKVFPAATDYRSAVLLSRYCCLPSAGALNDSGSVFKELLGQLIWR